jgi:hypothetical protein
MQKIDARPVQLSYSSPYFVAAAERRSIARRLTPRELIIRRLTSRELIVAGVTIGCLAGLVGFLI